MIRSFQRKITLLVLGFLLVILAGVVFAINYVNWKDLTDQAQYSLEVIVKNNGRRPGMGFRPEDDVPPPWLQEQQNPEDIGEAAYGSDADETAEADEDDSTEAEEADDKEDLDYGNNYEDFLDEIDDEEERPFRPEMGREADREFAANLSNLEGVRQEDGVALLLGAHLTFSKLTVEGSPSSREVGSGLEGFGIHTAIKFHCLADAAYHYVLRTWCHRVACGHIDEDVVGQTVEWSCMAAHFLTRD
jgi:hypothetical protein